MVIGLFVVNSPEIKKNWMSTSTFSELTLVWKCGNMFNLEKWKVMDFLHNACQGLVDACTMIQLCIKKSLM